MPRSRLARHYAAAGIAGFVAGATTGEGVLLDAREQDLRARRARAGLPIVVG